jgi:hypothetical protein
MKKLVEKYGEAFDAKFHPQKIEQAPTFVVCARHYVLHQQCLVQQPRPIGLELRLCSNHLGLGKAQTNPGLINTSYDKGDKPA